MHVSFGMAKHESGVCFLRFDDTNPEAEKQEYIDHIQEIVAWLGWEPFKVHPALRTNGVRGPSAGHWQGLFVHPGSRRGC